MAGAAPVRDAKLAGHLAAPDRGEREPRQAPQELPGGDHAARATRRAPTPPGRSRRRSRCEELETAIGELPEGARDALVLHALYGYSHGEAAQMLGIAEGTCKAQLHRARKLLRERLHMEVN